jgi:hypothetical protein
LKELQLIQILSIKNFGRVLPLLAAKIAARINRLIGRANAARRARRTPKRALRRRTRVLAVYRALTLSRGGLEKARAGGQRLEGKALAGAHAP